MGFAFFSSAQIEKKAEKLDVNGIVLYRFIPDNKLEGYYCGLKPLILIDSVKTDFIPNSVANYSILRENPELADKLGFPVNYTTPNLETNLCIHNAKYCKDKMINCDSILKVYQRFNIYDTTFFLSDFSQNMTSIIYSNSFYKFGKSDTICIAFSISGTAIKYENVIYGDQADYRILTSDGGSKEFDDSHGTCPFEKYNSTFLVLNEVAKYDKINKEKIESLGLVETNMTKLKVFLYE